MHPIRRTRFSVINIAVALNLVAMAVLTFTVTPALAAATRTFTGTGNFSDATKWDGGTLPTTGDNLLIVGTCTFDNAANNLAYGALTLGSGGTAGTVNWPFGGTNTLNATAIAANSAGGAIDMTNGGTLQVTTSWGAINLTFTAGTGTVNWNVTGAGSTFPSAYATYNNLTITTGTQTALLTASTNTINGNLTITSGTLDINGRTITVTGDTTVNGTIFIQSSAGTRTFGNMTINSGGTLNDSVTAPIAYNGDVTINSGGTLTESYAATMSFAGSFKNDGTYTASTGAHTFSGASKTFSGANTISIPSVSVSGTYTNSGTSTVSTTLAGAGALTNGATGTLNIGGTSSITTLANAGIINRSGTGTTTTALANFTNTGTINISGSGAITGITNNAGGIVNHSGSSTITSFNNATSTSTLNISTTPTVPTFSTLTITAAGNTVNYSGAGNQAIKTGASYSNLTLSGSGVKTSSPSNFPGVNGILSMEGTATITTPTFIQYGVAATLQYNTATARTAGNSEWPASFVATGGVIIANTGTITMNAAKAFGVSAPLTINSGATLAFGNPLTFGGNFVNGGTLTATAGISSITIASTMVTQSIAGFTTTGGLTVTKTGGTATLQSATSPGALTMSGVGGTLNLGSGLTHTVSSVTMTNGTLDGGSSTLNVTGNWSGTGGTFTASTGTVGFTGGSAQSITGSRSFNHLTLNNSSGLTISANETVSNTLTLTNGNITTGSNTVIIGASGSVSRSSGHVIGNLVKAIDSNGSVSRTFEVGTGSDYTPIDVTISGVTGSGSSGQTLAGSSTGTEHASISTSGIDSTKDVNRYWTLTYGGTWTFISYNAAFNFVNGDVDSGATTSAFIVRKFTSGTWARPPGGVTTSSSYTTGLAFTSFSDYAVGDPLPWDSYQDSGRTTVQNTFTSSYTTVYMKGTGFANTSYLIAYYDANGVKRGSETQSASSGTLLSSYLLTSDPNAAAGTWHALVQPSSGYTGFGTASYATIIASPDTYGLLANDSFTVEQSAIGTPPTAAITYSVPGPYQSGASVNITATFSAAMADSPVVQIAISGANTLAATNMTKSSTTVYTYAYTVGAGSGTATVALSTGTDIFGNVITAAPTSGATFTVVNAPTVSAVGIYRTDNTTAVTSMDPQTEYAIKVTVSDNDTLADLNTVKVTIFYDSSGTYNPANIPTSGNTTTAAILTVTVGGTPSWSIDPSANTTWSIISANSVQPTLSGTSGDFWFHFKPGKVATATAGSAKWHIYAKATDNETLTGDNYQANRTMNWYGELTVNTSSVSWGSVTPGSGFGAGVNKQTGISLTYIANGNYKTQVMSSATWTGTGANATFDNAGNCSSTGQFSLKAYSSDTFSSAVQVTTSGADIDTTGVQTTEAGTTVATNTLWLKVASVFRNTVYSGTITYIIASR